MTDKTSELPLLHLDSVLPSSDGWLRWSTVLLASSLTAFIGVSAFLSVDQTVRAQGVIRPSNAYPVVTTPIAGTLKALYISENDGVVADQTLGELQTGETIQPLIAPEDGIVFQLSANLLGKSLPAGTPVTAIAPLHRELTLKLQVNTQDIAQLAAGQIVQARVSAYPYPNYGILTGAIDEIAPDVTPCNTCSTPYGYVVNVTLPHNYLQQQDQRYPLAPGMDVTADIVTQRTRLLSIVLKKLKLSTDI